MPQIFGPPTKRGILYKPGFVNMKSESDQRTYNLAIPWLAVQALDRTPWSGRLTNQSVSGKIR